MDISFPDDRAQPCNNFVRGLDSFFITIIDLDYFELLLELCFNDARIGQTI